MKLLDRAALVLDGLVNLFLGAAIVLILLISGYSLWDNLYLYGSAQDQTLLTYKPDLDRPLQLYDASQTSASALSENRGETAQAEFVIGLPGQVAWLSVFGTGIDFPVMQGANNLEYLNKDPYGEFSLSGSIFLDYRSDSRLTDPYSVIYGHHMEHGKMFGSLDDYLDESYFSVHRLGRVITGDGAYELRLFAVCHADGSDQRIFNPTGRSSAAVIDYLRDQSVIFEDPQEGLPLVALTTCFGEEYTSRLAVIGTLREL